MRTLKTCLAVCFAALSAGSILAQDSNREIVQAFKRDPQTKNAYIQADTYHDLVILHGWVSLRSERAYIEEKVKARPGVNRVYDYIVAAEDAPTVDKIVKQGEAINVSSSYADNRARSLDENRPDAVWQYAVERAPATSAPSTLAKRVKEELDADPVTGQFNVRIDEYEGLVVLHGRMPTTASARDAASIASRIHGVRRVYSYIFSDEIVAAAEALTPYVIGETELLRETAEPEGNFVNYAPCEGCPAPR